MITAFAPFATSTSLVAAQPGWYSVTLSHDQSELEEYPVIAWKFWNYDDEERRKQSKYLQDTTVSPATPICLHGESRDGMSGALKDPNGTYWLQASPLTREETLQWLRRIQQTRDEMQREADGVTGG
jgi:hypothetical protein